MTTFSYVETADAHELAGPAVVIDVIRAYTTAAWALHLGATDITLVADLDEALALKAARPGSLAFCDGEPKDGFDLSNSPVQLLDLDVAGKRIAQRTSNGTQGVVAARSASPLMCASFVVASATARRLRQLNPDHVTFVITGDIEDLACAEYIAGLVAGEPPDLSAVARARTSPVIPRLADAITRGYTGIDPGDVDMCFELDRFDMALDVTVEDDHLVMRAVAA